MKERTLNRIRRGLSQTTEHVKESQRTASFSQISPFTAVKSYKTEFKFSTNINSVPVYTVSQTELFPISSTRTLARPAAGIQFNRMWQCIADGLLFPNNPDHKEFIARETNSRCVEIEIRDGFISCCQRAKDRSKVPAKGRSTNANEML